VRILLPPHHAVRAANGDGKLSAQEVKKLILGKKIQIDASGSASGAESVTALQSALARYLE